MGTNHPQGQRLAPISRLWPSARAKWNHWNGEHDKDPSLACDITSKSETARQWVTSSQLTSCRFPGHFLSKQPAHLTHSMPYGTRRLTIHPGTFFSRMYLTRRFELKCFPWNTTLLQSHADIFPEVSYFHAGYMPCPSQSSRFDYFGYIMWTIQTVKFLIVEPPPLPILIPRHILIMQMKSD